MGLGRLALELGQQEEARPLLQEARAGFAALGLANWVASVDQVLARAQGNVLTLEGLAAMVRAAREGDEDAGAQVWTLCEALVQSGDSDYIILGGALQAVLTGEPLEAAFTALPDDVRDTLLRVLL